MQLHQIGSVIKLPLELAKGCQKVYYNLMILVNECISHVQFLTERKVSTQD